ncbi:unnamed protein product [Larinioides sclopetarius]|uniref:Peptidase S1 domain-containing protein n=1 Tax=Larinioides sclopetarius TaxID=280406 RepID=A0AAV1Z1P7_9ARAC
MLRLFCFYLLFIITITYTYSSKALGKERKQNENCGRCGRRIPALEGFRLRDRIIDGRQVKPPFKYPWIVKVDTSRTCSGSIISKRYILTSAFCLTKSESDNNKNCTEGKLPKECYVQTSDVKVRLPWKESTKFRKTLSANKLLPHPDYDHICKSNDIALIRVSEAIKCNSFKQPICLPTSDINGIGRKLVITGWGNITPDGTVGSRVLREGEMKQIPFYDCHIYPCFDKNSTKAICAIGTNTHQTPCKGDSGASTFGEFNRTYIALGITSLPSSFFCQPSQSIMYTKVHAYIDWIKQYVRKLPEPYKNFGRLSDLEIDNEPYES